MNIFILMGDSSKTVHCQTLISAVRSKYGIVLEEVDEGDLHWTGEAKASIGDMQSELQALVAAAGLAGRVDRVECY